MLLRLLIGMCLFTATNTYSQPFTRIEASTLVKDRGDSRSVNFIDYDNDGDLDLFVSNGPKAGESNFLYRNDGTGSFIKVTEGALVSARQPSVGTAWGDYDNDGLIDLYVTNWYGRPNQLYKNGGGSFIEIKSGNVVMDNGYSEAATWGDFDNDGDLDLYVANSEGDLLNAFYVNQGNGSFTRISSGDVVTDKGASRSVNFVDYDQDGDLDLFVANEYAQVNKLYRNQLTETGTASYETVTEGPVVSHKATSVSSSWGDYDNDGDLDLFVANAGEDENNALYTNNGDGTFSSWDAGPVVEDGGSSFGSGWADYDNDGDLDLFVSNAYRGETLNFLYQNDGEGGLARVKEGPIASETGWTYGSAWADYDNDGDLDLFIAKTSDQSNVFYRNDANQGNHWLLLNLVGTTSNRSGIGAVVQIKATIQGRQILQTREVTAQSGYAGQNLRLHFGLGDAESVESLHILWPSGDEQIQHAVAVDQVLTITEGQDAK